MKTNASITTFLRYLILSVKQSTIEVLTLGNTFIIDADSFEYSVHNDCILIHFWKNVRDHQAEAGTLNIKLDAKLINSKDGVKLVDGNLSITICNSTNLSEYQKDNG